MTAFSVKLAHYIGEDRFPAQVMRVWSGASAWDKFPLQVWKDFGRGGPGDEDVPSSVETACLILASALIFDEDPPQAALDALVRPFGRMPRCTTKFVERA